MSENLREFVAIAVATETGAMPCGACRQVLSEFGGPAGELRIIVAGENGPIRHYTISELLFEGFTPKQLQRSS